MPATVDFHGEPDFISVSATQVEAARITVPDFQTARVTLTAMARGLEDGTSAMWGAQACVKTTGTAGSNTLATVGAVVNVFPARKDVAAALWDITFQISGTDIVVKVTGDAGQSVGWFFDIDGTGFWTVNH